MKHLRVYINALQYAIITAFDDWWLIYANQLFP